MMLPHQPASRRPASRPRLGPGTGGHLPIIAVVALVMAACSGSSPGGYDVADRVLAAVDQPVGAESGDGGGSDPADSKTSTGGDCIIVEVVDEYGFVDEVSTCPTDQPATLASREPGPIEPLDVVAAAGDLPQWVHDELLRSAPEPARTHLTSITESIEALERSCGIDRNAWIEALTVVTERAEAMIVTIQAGDLDGYLATPDAEAMSRSLMERALLLTGCAEPAGGPPVPADQLVGDGTLDLTARSVQVLTDLGRLLDGGPSGFLFHYFSTSPNYHWLRTQYRNLDLVVYGTSQAGAGIEVPVLADELSLSVGNAFLPGSLAEVQQHWFPEVERFVDPGTVVWLLSPIDLLIGCETSGREEQFTERLDRRRRTFTAPGWFAEVDHIDLILGPPGPENTNRGNAEKKPAPVQSDIDAHRTDYRPQLANPEFCHQRAQVIGSSIERMVEDGRRVVVVGMPMSPLAYEHLPAGPRAASAAIESLRSEHLAGLDVEIIDLSAALQDRADRWADYTHLTQDGAVAFTTALADAIEDLPR